MRDFIASVIARHKSGHLTTRQALALIAWAAR